MGARSIANRFATVSKDRTTRRLGAAHFHVTPKIRLVTGLRALCSGDSDQRAGVVNGPGFRHSQRLEPFLSPFVIVSHVRVLRSENIYYETYLAKDAGDSGPSERIARLKRQKTGAKAACDG